MSLSRRKLTQEFKRAAMRRLEMGASLAEVARACEVNAKCPAPLEAEVP